MCLRKVLHAPVVENGGAEGIGRNFAIRQKVPSGDELVAQIN
jgi:hypothetical protein